MNSLKTLRYKKLTNILYNSQECTLSSIADVSIFVIFMQMEHTKKLIKNEYSYMNDSRTAVHKHHQHNMAHGHSFYTVNPHFSHA
jgi:hypothetical protein